MILPPPLSSLWRLLLQEAYLYKIILKSHDVLSKKGIMKVTMCH